MAFATDKEIFSIREEDGVYKFYGHYLPPLHNPISVVRSCGDSICFFASPYVYVRDMKSLTIEPCDNDVIDIAMTRDRALLMTKRGKLLEMRSGFTRPIPVKTNNIARIIHSDKDRLLFVSVNQHNSIFQGEVRNGVIEEARAIPLRFFVLGLLPLPPHFHLPRWLGGRDVKCIVLTPSLHFALTSDGEVLCTDKGYDVSRAHGMKVIFGHEWYVIGVREDNSLCVVYPEWRELDIDNPVLITSAGIISS